MQLHYPVKPVVLSAKEKKQSGLILILFDKTYLITCKLLFYYCINVGVISRIVIYEVDTVVRNRATVFVKEIKSVFKSCLKTFKVFYRYTADA